MSRRRSTFHLATLQCCKQLEYSPHPLAYPSLTRQRRIFPSSPPLTTCFPSTRSVTDHMLHQLSILIVFPEGWTSLDSRLLVSIPFIISPSTHHSLTASRFLQTLSVRESERWEEACVGCLLLACHYRPTYVSLIFTYQFAHCLLSNFGACLRLTLSGCCAPKPRLLGEPRFKLLNALNIAVQVRCLSSLIHGS